MRILICLQILFLLILGKFDSEAQYISIQGISPVHAVNITKKTTTNKQTTPASASPITQLSPTTNPVVGANPYLNNTPMPTKGRRIALLIGNGTYNFGGSLGENPKNDVQDLGKALTALGFEVKILVDANLQNVKQAIKTFQEKITGAEMATFFYAGHGMEIAGKKYIIPVDAQLKRPEDLDDFAYNIDFLFRRLKTGGAKHNLIVLDACRNDPFQIQARANIETERAWKDANVFSPIQLNRFNAGNVYLAMATDWGNKAKNGYGRNGVYTTQLLKFLKSGERLERVFDLTGIQVKRETQMEQNPQFFKEVSIADEFIF